MTREDIVLMLGTRFTRQWAPGDLAGILPSSLIDKWRSHEQQYTRGNQLGLVIGPSHRWVEDGDEDVQPTYLVLIANALPPPERTPAPDIYVAPGLYLVPAHRLVDPTELLSPGRLFGRLKPTE